MRTSDSPSPVPPYAVVDPVQAWLDLGDARLQAGDDGKATAAYKTSLELAPKPTRAAAGACTGCR